MERKNKAGTHTLSENWYDGSIGELLNWIRWNKKEKKEKFDPDDVKNSFALEVKLVNHHHLFPYHHTPKTISSSTNSSSS